MVKEFQLINIRVILDKIMRHPMLRDLSLELVIQYALEFISIMGLPKTYIDKCSTLEISNHRALLPCDVVAINQVRSVDNGRYFRSMTDNFNGTDKHGEYTFKTQGSMIYTSIEKGNIEISYKAIPTDEEGLPLLPDNEIFLKTLELYIKKEWFTILFDEGKISPAVLQNTQQEYYLKAGQCNNEFIIPSESEMQTLTNMWNKIIPNVSSFYHGFKDEGDREYIKLH